MPQKVISATIRRQGGGGFVDTTKKKLAREFSVDPPACHSGKRMALRIARPHSARRKQISAGPHTHKPATSGGAGRQTKTGRWDHVRCQPGFGIGSKGAKRGGNANRLVVRNPIRKRYGIGFRRARPGRTSENSLGGSTGERVQNAATGFFISQGALADRPTKDRACAQNGIRLKKTGLSLPPPPPGARGGWFGASGGKTGIAVP